MNMLSTRDGLIYYSSWFQDTWLQRFLKHSVEIRIHIFIFSYLNRLRLKSP